MTDNDVRRDNPVSPHTSEVYFSMADDAASIGHMDEADRYWQLGAKRALEEIGMPSKPPRDWKSDD